MKPTIEQLAEKLGKTVWTKGELKRIYLNDYGYNTKKMTTKTFIWQDETGEFKVSCKIDCPSQTFQWINSQEEEVKQSVYEDIESIIKLMDVSLIKYKNLEESSEIMVYIKKGDNEPSWYTEEIFYQEFGKYPQYVFTEITFEKKEEKPVIKIKPEPVSKKQSIKKFEIGETLIHATFGHVIVISEDDNTVTVDLQGEQKKLLKKFAPLSRAK